MDFVEFVSKNVWNAMKMKKLLKLREFSAIKNIFSMLNVFKFIFRAIRCALIAMRM